MPMLESKLATELEAMTPTDDELVAADRLATAYANFASDATGSGVPLTPAGVELGRLAMVAVLAGLAIPGADAAALLAASIIAFWGAVALGSTTSFPGATVVTPPPNVGLAVGIPLVFAVNVASSLTLSQSSAALAVTLYSQAIIGGTVTIGTGSPGPII